MTDDPTDAVFIGIATGMQEQTESWNPADYKWSKIKADDSTVAYTIMLDNENMTFVADGSGVATSDQSYETHIIIYKGTQRVTKFQISFDKIKVPQGFRLTADTNQALLTFGCRNGSLLSGNSGSVEIPIIVDGLVFPKAITYTVNKNGAEEKYIWIAYADNSRPFSNEFLESSEGAKYIGVARDKDTPVQSTDFRDYEWFPLNNTGDAAVGMQMIYLKTTEDDASKIPPPNSDAYALSVQEGILTVDQGSLATGISPWVEDKPEYQPGYNLWTSVRVELSDGTYVYTSAVRSTEWDENILKIGGAQLIRNSKTLIDSRIYWF